MTDVRDADDPLADFSAEQRQRRLRTGGIALAVVVLIGLGWWWRRSTALPPLDPSVEHDVESAMDGLSTVPHELHAALAAAAMAELEANRLPPAMVEAFADIQSVPPELVGRVAMRPFSDDADSLHAWTVACTSGPASIGDVVATGDIDKLFADCELGRWSLIDGTAARRLSAGRLILAHAAWGWLVDHHSETELERRVLRVFVQG